MEQKAWSERRTRYYKKFAKICVICEHSSKADRKAARKRKKRNHLTLHHLKYTIYGQEKDQDLVCLCWNCHQALHVYDKAQRANAIKKGLRQKSLKQNSIDFIKKERRRLGKR